MSVPSIFLSYARENIELVERLERDLINSGIDVWLDRQSIRPAENWSNSIYRAIMSSDVFAVVVSKELIRRKETWVLRECEIASAFQPFVTKCLNMVLRRRARLPILVQVVIDDASGRDIDNFFISNRLTKFNEYNRISAFPDYRSGLARTLEALNVTAPVADTRRSKISKTKINGWVIDQLPRYQIFVPPIAEDQIVTSIVPARTLPEPLKSYYDQHLETTIEFVRAAGKAVTINKGYSAREIVFDKEHIDGAAQRSHRPRIVFEDTDYSYQLMFSEKMDARATIEVSSSLYSIREYLERFKNIYFADFAWEDISKVPFPQRFANVVCLVVANSEQLGLVVGIRASQSNVENVAQEAVPCTVSCAEGMLRPDDVPPDRSDGAPSPIRTAVRALREELGLKEGLDFNLSDVKMMALGYDANRCQPVAVHLLELPKLDFSQVLEKWNGAPDNHENRSLEWIPLDKHEYDMFMNDQWRWRGKKLKLFSNHQRFGAAILGLHVFGGSS